MIETVIEGELIRYDPGTVMGFEFVKHKPRPKCGAIQMRPGRPAVCDLDAGHADSRHWDPLLRVSWSGK